MSIEFNAGRLEESEGISGLEIGEFQTIALDDGTEAAQVDMRYTENNLAVIYRATFVKGDAYFAQLALTSLPSRFESEGDLFAKMIGSLRFS